MNWLQIIEIIVLCLIVFALGIITGLALCNMIIKKGK